jgi:hypothetical protein
VPPGASPAPAAPVDRAALARALGAPLGGAALGAPAAASKAQTNTLAKLGAKFGTLALLGAAAWGTRQLDSLRDRKRRELADPDEDAEELVQEGLREKLGQVFGSTEVGPWGKIGLGLGVAVGSMWFEGEDRELTAAEIMDLRRRRAARAAAIAAESPTTSSERSPEPTESDSDPGKDAASEEDT